MNSPPPLALLKLSCSKNTFRSVLWSLIINWVNVWWNVGSRFNTDSFFPSLSRSRMPLVFTLLCLCLLKMGGFSASVTQATVQSGESQVWLSGCDWSVYDRWRMNPLLLSSPETISILLIYQQPIRSHIWIIDPISSLTLDLPTNQKEVCVLNHRIYRNSAEWCKSKIRMSEWIWCRCL